MGSLVEVGKIINGGFNIAKRWGFTYIFCNDLEKMKWFYSDILPLILSVSLRKGARVENHLPQELGYLMYIQQGSYI